MSTTQALGLHRNAWIALGVFAVLFALVLITREEKISVGMRTLALPVLEKEKVERIEARGKIGSEMFHVVLEKQGEGWVAFDKEAPDKRYPAEQSAVVRALDALEGLEPGPFVTGRAEKHADLEVDGEKGTFVTVTSKDGATLSFVFGRYAKGGGNYVRLQGDDQVFIVKGGFASQMKRKLSAWRKRQLLDVEEPELVRVEIAPQGGERYALERVEREGEDATWRLVEGTALPEGFRVDEEALGRIARSIAGLRAAEFVDEAKAPEETGLSEGAAEVVAVLKDGKRFSIRFGKEDDKKRLFTRIEGDDQLYLVSSYSVKNVLKEKLELRDLSLFSFKPEEAERVVFRSPEGVVEIQKEEESWKLVAPADVPEDYVFDESQVEGKLRTLSRTKGVRFFENPPTLEKAGLASPALEVEVFLKGGASQKMAIGAEAPKAEETASAQFYALGADGNVYALGAYVKSRYEKPLELFKRVAAPPAPHGGSIPGMENLPPDVRKKLEESLQQQGLPGR